MTSNNARLLTSKEILELALRDGAKRTAVENFLGSLDNTMPKQFHIQNLLADMKLYGWNVATSKTIMDGIDKMYEN